MLFRDYISTLPELRDTSIEIALSSGESMQIDPVEGKKGSLRLLQAFLGEATEKSTTFPLEDFCEYYDEWLADPSGHHTTISFLDRYNSIGGYIKIVGQL